MLVWARRMVLPLVLLAATAVAVPAAAQSNKSNDDLETLDEVNDPIEPVNRLVFEINMGVDKLLLRPAAEVYRVLPQDVRDSVRNMFRNLDIPLTFVHDLLQGEGQRAVQSAQRFGINSTVGILGALDVAAGADRLNLETGIPPHEEDLGQTFGVWGVGEGPYLMVPVLGPSNARDLVGRVGDSFLDPVQYLLRNEHRMGAGIIRTSIKGLDQRSRTIETLDDIERNSIDFYATVRSLYRQHRKSEIANGETPKNPLPSMSDDFKMDDTEQERVSGEERVSLKH
jgi:phospholipid-binding lipoprotein MlaA